MTYIDLKEIEMVEGGVLPIDITVPAHTVKLGPEELEFRDAQVRGTITHEKRQYTIKVNASVAVGLICGRCLKPYDETVEFDELVNAASEAPEDGFATEGGQLELTQIVDELVCSMLPISRLCRPDCKGLCPHCGKDLNDGPCGCSDADEDDEPSGSMADLLKAWKN